MSRRSSPSFARGGPSAPNGGVDLSLLGSAEIAAAARAEIAAAAPEIIRAAAAGAIAQIDGRRRRSIVR